MQATKSSASTSHPRFREIDRAFFNYHPAPPSLLGDGDNGRIVNPDQIAELPEWRQMLQCSTYFTLSLRQ